MGLKMSSKYISLSPKFAYEKIVSPKSKIAGPRAQLFCKSMGVQAILTIR